MLHLRQCLIRRSRNPLQSLTNRKLDKGGKPRKVCRSVKNKHSINSNVALTPSCALQGSASTLLPPDGTIPPSLPKTTATLLVGPQRTTFSLQPQRASFHGAGSSTSSLTNGSAVGSSLSGAQISHRHSVALGEQENRRPPAGSIRRTGIPTRSNNRVLSAIPKSTTNYLTSGAASPTRLTMNAETLQRTRSSLRFAPATAFCDTMWIQYLGNLHL